MPRFQPILIALVAATACLRPDTALAATVAGGGSARTDCVLVLEIPAANRPAPPRTPRHVDCRDGDPACDADGEVNGACAFELQLCINSTELPRCEPSSIESITVANAIDDGRSRRYDPDFEAIQLAASALPLPSIAPNACTATRAITVPLRGPDTRGRLRRSSKTLRTTSLGSTLARSVRDRDRVRFTCRPAVSAPPAGDSGWTVFTPSAETQRVFLSAAGSDDLDCLSEETACRTLARGYDLMRHGFPDWLLLRRGDVFPGGFVWEKSGRSEDERMVLGTYGPSPERPLVHSGTHAGFHAYWNGPGGPPAVRHFAIVGLSFYADGNAAHDSSESITGIFLGGGIDDFVIEDTRIENYNLGIALQSANDVSPGRFVMRRNIIVSNWVFGGNALAIYLDGATEAEFIENLFDHNGWQEGMTPWSIFSLNAYTIRSPGIVVRGNTFSRADGIDVRSGGIVENNLFLRTTIGMTMGLSQEDHAEHNVQGRIGNNVFLEGVTLNENLPRGFALDINNVEALEVDANIFAHALTGSATSIRFSPYNDIGVGVNNVTVENNIVYRWGGASFGRRDNDPRSNIRIRDNIFQHFNPLPDWAPFIDVRNVQSQDPADDPVDLADYLFSGNVYYAPQHTFGINLQTIDFDQWVATVGESGASEQQVVFPDPERSIGDYDAHIGGAGSFDSFIAGARSLSKGAALDQPSNPATWRSEYSAAAVNDYIRAGFGR